MAGATAGPVTQGNSPAPQTARSSAPVSSCRCPEYATWTDSVPESRVPENRSWHVDQPAAAGIVRPVPVWIHAVIALRHSEAGALTEIGARTARLTHGRQRPSPRGPNSGSPGWTGVRVALGLSRTLRRACRGYS